MALQVAIKALPQAGERGTEGRAIGKFAALLGFAKGEVIALLAPSAGIGADGLKVAVRIGAKPGVGISGRQGDTV